MQDFFTVILAQQKSASILHSMRFRNEFQGETSTGRDPIIIGTAEGYLSALRIEGKLSSKKRPKLASAAVLSAFLWPSALICWIEIIV